MTNLYKFSIWFLSACLCACASMPKQKTDITEASEQNPDVLQPAESRKELPKTFHLSGAIAAKHHNKGWTATFDWTQRSDHNYDIRLFGPMGGGSIMIKQQGDVITYQEGKKILKSHDAETLLAKETGVKLPVKYLYYWVRGISAPGKVEEMSYDKNHDITSFKQAGYHIQYTEYLKSPHKPRKIDLMGHGLKVRVIVKSWG